MTEDQLKQKEIKEKLELAKIYLEGAQNSFNKGDLRLAADASYNSAELVMKAAILEKEDSVPKRHGGVAQLFSLLYIKEGPMKKEVGRQVGQALQLRNKARYEVGFNVSEKNARHNLALARKLIDFFEKNF